VRLIGTLLFLCGLVLTFAPSTMTGIVFGREIARASVFENGVFKPFSITLEPWHSPLAIDVEMQDGGQYQPTTSENVLAQAITFQPEDKLAETSISTFQKRVAGISLVESGPYSFAFADGDAETIDLRRVEVILRANAFDAGTVSNIAIAMIWIGFFIWFIGQRRRSRRLASQPVTPAKPAGTKWGRGE
jgi:hypothetical protein